MDEIAELALIPPKLNTSPLPRYDDDKLDCGMTIGIERTPGGRLWACWVAGGDSPKAFFVLAIRDDDGEKWSSPRLVVDSQSPDLPQELHRRRHPRHEAGRRRIEIEDVD